ncbi:MAG: hypothetical protein GXP14_03300 [Gammaproteobacteria bacterium]|nr:hypothetical protein [Gammaproteobacteria bacterium]
MNKLMFFFGALLLTTTFIWAAEPDESGIGGTGASKPSIVDGIFSRPEIPDFVDTPEVPEISVPDLSDDGAAIEGIDSSIPEDAKVPVETE